MVKNTYVLNLNHQNENKQNNKWNKSIFIQIEDSKEKNNTQEKFTLPQILKLRKYIKNNTKIEHVQLKIFLNIEIKQKFNL